MKGWRWQPSITSRSHSTTSIVRLCFQWWTVCTKRKSVFLFGNRRNTWSSLSPSPWLHVCRIRTRSEQQLLTNSPVGNKTIVLLFVLNADEMKCLLHLKWENPCNLTRVSEERQYCLGLSSDLPMSANKLQRF